MTELRKVIPDGAVSIFDLHCHTKEGSMDGLDPIIDVVRKMKDMGYTGLLVSDHNSYKGYETWMEEKHNYPELEDFIVLKALEYDTRNGGHVLVILPEGIEMQPLKVRGLTIDELLFEVHNMGGICGMCHPYGQGFYAAMHTKRVMLNIDVQMEYDFVEIYNAHIAEMSNDLAQILNEDLKKPYTAGTDAHKLKYVGTAATAFSCPVTNRDELIAAIKERKMIYAGPVGDIRHPQLRGIIRFFSVAGYRIWNFLAAIFYVGRRRRAWKDFRKNS